MAGLALGGLALVFWPFIDGALRKRRPGSEVGTAIGALAGVLLLVFLLWEALATH